MTITYTNHSSVFSSHTLFNRHKLYRAYPKNKDDVAFLDKILKAGDDGVRLPRRENIAILDYCAAWYVNGLKPDTLGIFGGETAF